MPCRRRRPITPRTAFSEAKSPATRWVRVASVLFIDAPLAERGRGVALATPACSRCGSSGLKAEVEVAVAFGMGGARAGGTVGGEDQQRHKQADSEQCRCPLERGRVPVDRRRARESFGASISLRANRPACGRSRECAKRSVRARCGRAQRGVRRWRDGWPGSPQRATERAKAGARGRGPQAPSERARECGKHRRSRARQEPMSGA